MRVRWLRIGLGLGLVALLTLSLPASEPSRSLETRLTLLLQGESFYFPEWALQAWAEKLLLSVANPQAFLDDETQRRAVRRYLQRLSEAREAAAALEREVSGPTPPDPGAIAALRRRWEEAHGRTQVLRPLAEAILSEQLGVILAQEGLALLGQPIPPVQIRLTAMPNLMVLSPRERIALTTSFPLRADLTADEMDRLERRVDGQLHVSSLVVPLGGLAFYPAMIMEATGLPELTEIIAHEWIHHWLFMGPLGWFYDRPEARTINETVADLAGKALGRAWLARPSLALHGAVRVVLRPPGGPHHQRDRRRSGREGLGPRLAGPFLPRGSPASASGRGPRAGSPGTAGLRFRPGAGEDPHRGGTPAGPG